MHNTDDIAALWRLVNIILGAFTLWYVIGWIKEVSPVANQKGKFALSIVLGWTCLAILGTLEQLLQEVPFGFRLFGTTAMLIVTIYTARIPGSTVGDGSVEPR